MSLKVQVSAKWVARLKLGIRGDVEQLTLDDQDYGVEGLTLRPTHG